jgi:GT2 family glycosyltransferase
MPTVSIIIINYNTFVLTCNCIESIFKHTQHVHFEIILVDNNSTERNADDFKKLFPSIILVKNQVNNGFANGNNLGIKQAQGDYILLLNSDTYFTENCIEKTLAFAAKNTNSIIGIKMLYPSGTIQYTARKFRNLQWELLDLCRFLLWFLPYQKRATIMLGKYFKANFTTNCDWLNGAFFMLPKQALQALPNQQLDNRFFMYGEDQLWCYQLKQLGYNCLFYHETSLVHINNGSSANKEKKLQLILTMIQHELQIMQYRVGKGWYYYIFCAIYLSKEYSRYGIKWVWLQVSGKLIK